MPDDDKPRDAPVISPARFREKEAEKAEYLGREGLYGVAVWRNGLSALRAE
jgi:hypothetical protein